METVFFPLFYIIHLGFSLVIPEYNCVSLLLLGHITFDPRISLGLNFSLNHVHFAILFIHLILIFRNKGMASAVNYVPILTFLPLLIWMGINAIFWSDHLHYGWIKYTGSVVGVFISYFLVLRYRLLGITSIYRFLFLLFGAVAIYTSAGFLNLILYHQTDRLVTWGGGTLSLARYAGYCIILGCAVYSFFQQWKLRAPVILLIGISLVTLINTASKGPVLFLWLVSGIALWLIWDTPPTWKKWSYWIGAGLVIVILIWIAEVEGRFLVNPFTEVDPNGSYQSRLTFWSRSLALIKDFPLVGIGWGDFVDYGVIGTITHGYPHNILFEIGAETGIVGILMFVIIIIPIGKFWQLGKIRTSNSAAEQIIIYSCLILALYTFLNLLVSYNFASSRFLWVFLTLTGLVNHRFYHHSLIKVSTAHAGDSNIPGIAK